MSDKSEKIAYLHQTCMNLVEEVVIDVKSKKALFPIQTQKILEFMSWYSKGNPKDLPVNA